MSKKEFDIAVFIGRFEPPHIGHIKIIENALNHADNVLVLVGSAFQFRTVKNPWTFDERKQILSTIFTEQNITFSPLRDEIYNDHKWIANVQDIVNRKITELQLTNPKVAIFGHIKDATSYYLKLFPQWKYVDSLVYEDISATDIRESMFEQKHMAYLQGVLPQASYSFVSNFIQTKEFMLLQKEYHMLKKYKQAWSAAPYPPIFNTVDAVVVQAGHILLIRRKAMPSVSALALPGGFLNSNEKIIDGMCRELREETKLRVPIPVLKGSVKAQHVFDAPDRSLRGRTITHAFFIELNSEQSELPKVKGSDDAKEAFWLPISMLNSEEMFEDHYSIIEHFIGT